MSDKIINLLRHFAFFCGNSVGTLNSPYATYRKIVVDDESAKQTVFIWFAAFLYFIFAVAIRSGLRNPYILTMELNILMISGMTGFFVFLCLLYLIGKVLGGRGKLKSFYILWVYSLLPTIIWFFLTSVMYLILPPPRTLSIWGKSFSIIFIALTIALFLWKAVLYYLTLRFGLKLELLKISLITLIVLPVAVVYSLFTYRLGIYRIPFL